MAKIAKQSVKVDLVNEGYDSQRDLLEDTFYTAVNTLSENEAEEDLLLTTRFFTMRFDETDNGTIAATVTASAKREA